MIGPKSDVTVRDLMHILMADLIAAIESNDKMQAEYCIEGIADFTHLYLVDNQTQEEKTA